MKKALVTGANGFVGSAVVRELLSNGVEVIALARDGHTENIPAGARIIAHELSESEMLPELIADRDIDVFYHFAWQGSAGAARADVELQLNNVKWTVDCLRASKKMDCKKFVCAGSIMEFEAPAITYKQDSKPMVGLVYGSAKAAAHSMCMMIASEIDMNISWTEITNAYGVGELSPRFLNSTLRKIINNEPLTFTSGTQNYDFIYIDDTAKAFRLIGEKGRPFRHYLIGSSHAKPLREFVLEIKSVLAPDREFIFGNVPFSGINLPPEAYDCSILEKDTGFKPDVSFADGIQKTFLWLKSQGG